MNFSLDEQLKKRLIGAAVLLSLLIIFLPSFWETEYSIDSGVAGGDVPESPMEKEQFRSKVQPLPSEQSQPAVISTPESKLTDLPVKQPPVRVPLPVKKPIIAPRNESKAALPSAKQTPPLSAWAVQVASFSEKSSAAKLTSDLQQLKYPAFVVPVDIKGKRWFRVRIGPEVDKKRATQVVERLRKIKGKGLKPNIVRHP